MTPKDATKKLSDTSFGSIDTYVGSRIRLRRGIVGYSQEKLAEEMGITFQQVQKYERGLNRVSAGRLWKLSQILGVSVNFFFDGIDTVKSPSLTGAPMGFCEEPTILEDNILERKDILELVRYYSQISDPKVAKNILDLVKSLAPSSDTLTNNE
ncbi:MAG: helix-turn-helix transcriptional regulator [Alphaproteobacteria bacterium]|nr:helix-turn-helix transcriptional regulator [Alphaproteobacteria bacterium]